MNKRNQVDSEFIFNLGSAIIGHFYDLARGKKYTRLSNKRIYFLKLLFFLDAIQNKKTTRQVVNCFKS